MVRSIIQTALPGVRIDGRFAENVDDWVQSSNDFDLVVLKAHPQKTLLSLIEFLKPPVILSVRDPRDCVASWLQMLGEGFSVFQPRLIHSCKAALRLARHKYTHTIRYEDGATTRPETVLEIASHLGLSISEHQAIALIKEFSSESVKAKIKEMADSGRLDSSERLVGDSKTLWLPAHVGDGKTGKYSQALRDDQIRAVNHWSRDYCKAFGYEVPEAPPIPRGHSLMSFGSDSDSLAYLRSGFSYPEVGFTWTDGDEATMQLPLLTPVDGRVICEFRYFRPRPKNAPPVKLAVMLLRGGEVISSMIDSGDGETMRFEIEDTKLFGVRELQFRIAIVNPYCPKAHNTSDDARWLGMALVSLSLSY